MPNGSGKQRYTADWERKSRGLRLLYPCFFCGENDYSKKECHHIDENKKNSSPENIVVLCIECHEKIHSGELKIPNGYKGYKIIEVSLIKSYR